MMTATGFEVHDLGEFVRYSDMLQWADEWYQIDEHDDCVYVIGKHTILYDTSGFFAIKKHESAKAAKIAALYDMVCKLEAFIVELEASDDPYMLVEYKEMQGYYQAELDDARKEE